MSDLFWPGDHRAGTAMSEQAFFAALVRAENAWLATLVAAGIAPPAAAADLGILTGEADIPGIAAGAEADGNPVTGLVALLRDRAGADAARWLHRGLTSQDVLDTALMLCLRDALAALAGALDRQVHALIGLTEQHRATPMLTRTLTQTALPGTAARRFANWLTGILDAVDTLKALPALPISAGGAAGTLAASTELAGSADAALALAGAWADRLGLAQAFPWHTTRAVLTRTGDALVGCCDAWGHIANDIAVGVRAGELAEGSGGGSSTMPHKSNPVLTVLLRRTALTAPQLGATLHAASAASVDERADGGWHAEWATLRTLVRRTLIAASQAAELLSGLRVDNARAATHQHDAQGIYAEQQTMAGLTGRSPAAQYLGATDVLVDLVLQRARNHLKEAQ
ncbi:3-carboxy-cis,cis-muconate cycloisomerase [Mycolicibacterium canariasense]|uniref:3-carboxy-cis,cis-muconate cycloisomerase n=1 Tax=Mycolicibacterium canariasense TaxID=228230 RepID=A0A100W7M8_MYCCR|nr:lyase family protein [Mycolicibacterium canariasense]MCV7211035.1 3-carboxy-cis,cis-muconate cycloisomerase [Mycolicibacterium canariasense]ORV01445.1 3-carboxy-cis,cis-muconate cycloisomerase [Mycolicibacterium canariasense]GAS93085.1 3-carboxy-cis,cis-muconate cycloisomerase [Mycolicibacterium canariasense]